MSNCEVKITFSDDEYEAFADFFSAAGNGGELSMLYVKSVVSEAGVTNGVDWDLVHTTIDYCNDNHKSKKGLTIATGTLPISEVPEHWNLEEKFFNNAMGFDTKNNLQVDYKEVSTFIMVKKGELIAKWDGGRPGVVGKSVKDKSLQFKRKNIVQFTKGQNTKEYQGNLYASTSGRYEVSDSREINIYDVLHIEGNVDYSTGNISFGKDVIIDGEIKDGFKVAAGGSLFCKSNVDATDILCRKDMVADKGIIGRKEAIIRVGGKLSARFIENCRVESKSGIIIEKNIVNSEVYSLGILDLGENGAIVSSHISVEMCIKTKNIGKLGSPNSNIEVGFSFVEKRIIESITQRIEVLKEKLKHLNKLPDYRKTDKKLNLITQIQNVVSKGVEELHQKTTNLYKYPDASICISGTIFPGNKITICGVEYGVTEEMKKVKFYLNKQSGLIEHVPL